MKKLLKSEICGSVNSAWNPHVAENLLKSQTFQLKKKTTTEIQMRLESAKCASQTYPYSSKKFLKFPKKKRGYKLGQF